MRPDYQRYVRDISGLLVMSDDVPLSRRIRDPQLALAAFKARQNRLVMADGLYYHDTRAPWVISSPSAVTLATTDKALYLKDHFPNLGSNYWWAGKKVELRVFGRATTAATPGNFTYDLYWGSGADATGTIVGASKAGVAIASQTNLCWMYWARLTCYAIGASGSLMCTGFVLHDEALLAAKLPIPASAPAAVTVDLTAANILSLQLKRSGSTAETAQVHEIEFSALN